MGLIERYFSKLAILTGLVGTGWFACWWFEPGHIVSWPLFILLSVSIGFFMMRTMGYWLLFDCARRPRFIPASTGLTVDVMTTAAPGEPVEMTRQCLLALKAMTYPHKTYLLDDSSNPVLAKFCKKHEIYYLTRREKNHAKCGNVNNALRQTHGEFVLIVDPDHIVEPCFLDRVLGHFRDPAVGFVQTAQAYYNQSRSFIAKAGAEQTYMFYGPVMTAMGALGSSLVIGTNCTFRRKALESVGLYKPGLAEDLHTSMALHSRGWKSVYVPEILARGLTPDDLAAFFHQQLKWSRGVLELLLNNFSHYAKGWSLLRKILYTLSMTYYFESIMVAINMTLPLLYIWGRHAAVNVTVEDFGLHLLPWLLVSLFFFFYSQKQLCHRNERGLMWRGMLLQFLSFPIHLLGILYALIGKDIPYLPTAKAAHDTYPLVLLLPHFAIIMVTLLGFQFGFCHACEGLCWGMLAFAAWNVTVLSIALVVSYGSHQKLFQKPFIPLHFQVSVSHAPLPVYSTARNIIGVLLPLMFIFR